MDAAEQWEPDEVRASRPVLQARGGETPPRDSPRDLLPTRQGGGSYDADADADDEAWVGGERDQDPDCSAAGGRLHVPRLHDRPVLREGRASLYRHAPIQEGCQGSAQTHPREHDAAMASRYP